MIMTTLNANGSGDLTTEHDPGMGSRLVLNLVIVATAVAAAGAIGAILVWGLEGAGWQAVLSVGAVGIYGAVGLTALVGFERRTPLLHIISLVEAGIGLTLTLVYIWTLGENDFLERVTFSAFILAASLVHANLLIPNQDDRASGIATMTLAANAVVTGMIVVPLLTDVEPAESYWKAFGVPLVLFVLGTLAVPLARTMGDGDDESLETDVPIVPSGGGRELDVRYQGRRFR
ncbi:MAG TPA: hypothetical protein VFK36_09515, partial [Gemmatimonadales bacterium]|nr:hypothetical protein [Gemmatimonadales bacterium]